MKPLLPLLASLALVAPAAAPSAALHSYLQARAVLEAGIQAIGGESALRATGPIRRRMEREWYGSGQGRRPEPFAGPTLAAPTSNSHDVVDSVIDRDGGRWADEVQESVNTADTVTHITAVGARHGFETIAYRQERPFLHQYASEELPALRVARFRRYPEGALLMALERPETLQWVGLDTQQGRGQQVISFADPQGTRVFLHFDAQTHRLTKWETLRSHAVAGDSFAELLFGDYRAVQGLTLPFRCVDRVAGVPTQEWKTSAIELRATVPEERFVPPRDAAPMIKDPPEPELQKLGDGLYLIRASYNTMFAVFRDFAVVFEAPLSGAFAEAQLKMVRATATGKPVRYVVATHFHVDHVAGVRAYVAEGVPIITAIDAGAVIERVAAARHTLHPDALSRRPVLPRIEAVEGTRVIEDGANRAELHDVGPTDHAAHILVAYFPKERVLFVPDLWDVLSTELVIAGSDTVALARKVRELDLKVDRIVPVHGAPATSQMLEQALAVRAKYVR